MFFKKSNSACEIESSVLKNLPNQKNEGDIQIALQSLADSADIFESMNLPEEAEVITQFMETIASGQFALVKKAKNKLSKTNVFSKDLSPEKQIKNQENFGWVFNMPDSESSDCSLADDDDFFEAEIVHGPKPDKRDSFLKKIVRDHKSQEEERGRKSREDKDDDLPLDYEECGECGFDHAYEPDESFKAHFPEKDSQIAEIVPKEESGEYFFNSIDV